MGGGRCRHAHHRRYSTAVLLLLLLLLLLMLRHINQPALQPSRACPAVPPACCIQQLHHFPPRSFGTYAPGCHAVNDVNDLTRLHVQRFSVLHGQLCKCETCGGCTGGDCDVGGYGDVLMGNTPAAAAAATAAPRPARR